MLLTYLFEFYYICYKILRKNSKTNISIINVEIVWSNLAKVNHLRKKEN